MHGSAGGGLGGNGQLRRASIIVRPSSQSRTPREVADTSVFMLLSQSRAPREAADKAVCACHKATETAVQHTLVMVIIFSCSAQGNMFAACASDV